MDVKDTELSKEHILAIITAVNLRNKIIKLYVCANNLSEVDPGLQTKAVTKLVRLDLVNTKLTQQQEEAILVHSMKDAKLS